MKSKGGSRPTVRPGTRRWAATLLAVAALTAACGTGRAADPAASRSAPAAEAVRAPAAGSGSQAWHAVRAGGESGMPPGMSSGPALSVRAAGQSAGCRRAKCIALTFDDGPGRYTGTLLRHLADHRAHATFFVVGRNVAADPGPVRQAVEAGHEIGNHSWSHRNLTTLSGAEIRSDLARTDRAVKAAAGVTPKLVRPPYGAFNETVRRQTTRPVVLWSVDTEDWRYRDSAAVARKAVKSASPGGIILFHDIHPTTVKAIPKVLESLSARGYKFVTVSELYGGKAPKLVYGGSPRPAVAL
ncbi:polysaccharide deacetylase family protein [Planobispora takensis]|uniref:NodB homology domain-containing protein n=1 Tax=Planobispora takensis TaxID=1367882 RepID=A0A8J3T345_9ACTN|nr:polysaccharide deacetylase family protein [Planobispora takensis]GII04371.1 hypothetical protein Pta02_63790 [Planobispora takensis]